MVRKRHANNDDAEAFDYEKWADLMVAAAKEVAPVASNAKHQKRRANTGLTWEEWWTETGAARHKARCEAEARCRQSRRQGHRGARG